MRRTTLRLDDLAERDHLAWAFWRAAQGKRCRPDVRAFAQGLDSNLDRLQAEILDGTVEVGRMTRFWIRDPKPRLIHAPCFRERVLHHALMAYLGPVFDRYLVGDTFACRPGKGSWAAVLRAQEHGRSHNWFLKMDMRSYFASIDQEVLRAQIRRRIKGRGALELCDRIIASHESRPRKGLPIGSLTSQHFANLYLAPLDRFLLEALKVEGMVRYMDDVVAWGKTRSRLREVHQSSQEFVANELRLEIKPSAVVQQSRRGLTLCGFRIHPGRLGLSQRRRRRYRQARTRWEAAYLSGSIDATALQRGYAGALAITTGADSLAWRRRELDRRPPIEA